MPERESVWSHWVPLVVALLPFSPEYPRIFFQLSVSLFSADFFENRSSSTKFEASSSLYHPSGSKLLRTRIRRRMRWWRGQPRLRRKNMFCSTSGPPFFLLSLNSDVNAGDGLQQRRLFQQLMLTLPSRLRDFQLTANWLDETVKNIISVSLEASSVNIIII